jgi:hypothetical protein
VSRLIPPRGQLAPLALERFALALAASPEDWQERLTPADLNARCYAEIWSDENVNAWAIRWSDDADTGFHDHDVAAAGIAVIEGLVVEERLTLGGPPIARHFGHGSSFHLSASAIHRVRHGGGGTALTVHAYSPPLRVQGVYRITDDGALERDVVPYTEELHGELAVAA